MSLVFTSTWRSLVALAAVIIWIVLKESAEALRGLPHTLSAVEENSSSSITNSTCLVQSLEGALRSTHCNSVSCRSCDLPGWMFTGSASVARR